MNLMMDDKILELITRDEIKSDDFHQFLIELEKIYQINTIPYNQDEITRDTEEIITRCESLKDAKDLLESSQLNGEISQKLHFFRTKYSDFITNNTLLEEIQNQEKTFAWKEKIQKVSLIKKNIYSSFKGNPQIETLEFKNILLQYLEVTEILLDSVENYYLILN